MPLTSEPLDGEMLASVVRGYEEVPWLRQMRELIRRWWGVEGLYVDRTGQPVYLSGQPHKLKNRVCAVCLASDRGRALCQESMAQGNAEAAQLGRSSSLLTYNCHLGLGTMVMPVVIEDRHRGMVYTTGFFDHPPTRAEREQVVSLGGRINPALGNEEILASVPTLGPEDLTQLDDILQLGVWAIVSLYSEIRSKEEEIATLRQRLQERGGFAGIVGASSSMQEVYHLVDRVAGNDATVLVRGESGTGKELVARAIHGRSHRSEGPFVVQNCSAFNDNLLESELFGHVRGAFTGAVSDKKGLFEIANNGTLFLDEVAEMSQALQAKLLRVLQDQTFWPVGATTPKKSDVRIVAATHRDLEAMVADERFREDLYYRINVISIALPPLRERRNDIPPLVQHFLKRHGGGSRLSRDALRVLSDYDWPGNVRELANEIERMTVLADGQQELGVDLISSRVRGTASIRSEGDVPKGTMREAIEDLEARMIRSALGQCNGNRSHAAKLLGIARSNLLVKIKSYGIDA
jgi:two-component system response regulator HupR/HoxA